VFDGLCGSRGVINEAIVVSEVKFAQIPMQMLAAHTVECAVDSALQEREDAFNSVAMRAIRQRIFTRSVIGHAAACELLPDTSTWMWLSAVKCHVKVKFRI
jgi:hypothetical protein